MTLENTKNKENVIMWQFAIISGLQHLYGKISGYVVIYRSKDKNTTQGNLAVPGMLKHGVKFAPT